MLSILINLLMILSLELVVKDGVPEMQASPQEAMVIRLISVCQLLSQIILFIFFMINRAPIILKKHESKKVKPRENRCARLLYSLFRKIEIVLNGEDVLLMVLMMILSFLGVFYRTYIYVLHLVEIFVILS